MPSTHSVQALAFSPDNKWIAVAVGRHYKPGTSDPREFASHVIVVPTEGDAAHPLQIDPGVWVTQNALIWAPDSSAVLISADAAPKWYAIPGGELWKHGKPDSRLNMVLGFVDARLGMAYASQEERSRAEREGAPRVLYIFDLTGRIVDEWRVPSRWWFAAVNPDRHLVAVSEDSRLASAPFPIFAYPSKAEIQGWSVDKTFGWPNFAEAGKTVCGFGGYGRAVPYATCWDVDTGKKIAGFRGFRGGDPVSVSSQASRIVLTHIRNYRGITEEFDMHSYHDRVVWDFRTDKVIAEWVPITQATETGMRPPEDKRTEFGPSVISPSGRYIAEGSNGIIRIYELP
ncbi:MAG: hypothetical protein ABSG03_40545 [Bryobacteraceae bacterium]